MPKREISPTYKPAQLKRCAKSDWYIEYYVTHPQQKELKRIKIRVNHIRKRFDYLRDFKEEINRRIIIINSKLAGGWSPFFESDNSRYYTPLSNVIELYIAEKSRELRPATMRCYTSCCAMINEWANKEVPNIYCSLFNKVLAVKYLDHVYAKKKTSARTYNNQLKMGRALFSWAVEKCYCKENPFEQIKTKREEEKRRILIPPAYRERIDAWCQENNPAFGMVMRLVFASLIRPKEICCLQVKHLYLNEHYIHIPSSIAKNHHDRFAAISPEVEDYFGSLKLSRYKPDAYLFGLNYTPGMKPIGEARFRKDWDKMRKALKLPKEMQLYSLRDTGINNLLKSGVDPLTVMQHADHHDLSMTTRYANHADPQLVDRIRKSGLKF